MKRMLTTAMAASRVCFLTDIEGNWQYVRNFVRQSTCLRFRDAQERELELQDDCVLVFGGDAGDKGEATLHCYEELVRLKKQYPDRVVLLVGNRDVNKMRFTSELHDSELDLATMATEIRDGPAWVPEERRMTVPKFLAKKTAEQSAVSVVEGMQNQSQTQTQTEGTCDAATDMALSSPALAAVNTKVNRLHWMLSYTMGSHGDFEQRRKELQEKRATDTLAEVSDDDVVQSFTSSVAPGGVLREFLQLGSLAFVAHGTLFVHGGIVNPASGKELLATSALGRVPQDPNVYENVHKWTTRLNEWYTSQIHEWIEQPTWTADKKTRGGQELLAYVLPSYTHSVIMGRHLDKSGMPVALPDAVAKSLADSGISRIVVGHTPHGTCPTVIKQPTASSASTTAAQCFQEVIMCDTSYSDMAAPDNRGAAASELVVHADGRGEIHGVLENGRRIAFPTDSSSNATSADCIGRLLLDGMRVKAKLVGTHDQDDEFLAFKVENGFSYTYAYRSLAELEEIGFVHDNVPI